MSHQQHDNDCPASISLERLQAEATEIGHKLAEAYGESNNPLAVLIALAAVTGNRGADTELVRRFEGVGWIFACARQGARGLRVLLRRRLRCPDRAGMNQLESTLETSVVHVKDIKPRGELPTSQQLERVHLELDWLVLKTKLGIKWKNESF